MPRVRVSPLGPKVQNLLVQVLDFSVCMERDSKDQMRLSGGQSLADGLTAATPLFSSFREENANESRPSDQNRQFSVRKPAVLSLLEPDVSDKIISLRISSEHLVPSSTLEVS